MARRRSDGGVEECKAYSPPNDHTTSASSTPLPLDSWDLNAGTTRLCLLPLGSWDLNAGTRSTETESFRSARVARRRATYAERTERQRLRDAHERRMAGGASPAAGDSTSNWKTRFRCESVHSFVPSVYVDELLCYYKNKRFLFAIFVRQVFPSCYTIYQCFHITYVSPAHCIRLCLKCT